MTATIIRKRIEVLADQAHVRLVTSAIDRVGISGWTILHVEAGKGSTGPWHEERVLGTDKSLIVTITDEARAAALIDEIAPMLDSHGLVLTMASVEVVRGEKF